MSRQKIKQFMRKFDDEDIRVDKKSVKTRMNERVEHRDREREQERERDRQREREMEQERQRERERERELEIEQEREQERLRENEHEIENRENEQSEQYIGEKVQEHAEIEHIKEDKSSNHEERKQRRKKEESQEEKREIVFVEEEDDTEEVDSSNPFSELNKQVFVKYLKTIGFSVTNDVVNSLYVIISELVYTIFFKILSQKRDEGVTITLSDVTNLMSNYVEDEDMPEEVFIPMKMFYAGINNVCKDCKCVIKRDALIHLHLFTEFLLNKIVGNASLISKNAKRNRVSGKDIILSHKLALF